MHLLQVVCFVFTIGLRDLSQYIEPDLSCIRTVTSWLACETRTLYELLYLLLKWYLFYFRTFEVTSQSFYRASLSYAIVNLKPIVPGRE